VSRVMVLVFVNGISIRRILRMGFPLQEGEVLALADGEPFVFLSLLFDSSLMKLTYTC